MLFADRGRKAIGRQMTASFSATIEAWANQSKDDITRIFRQSVARVVTEMQTPVAAGGNMPIDTGALRASLVVNRSGPVPMSREATGKPVTYSSGPISLVIAGADIGDTVWASYTMQYSAMVHFGANGRPGRQWVTLAAQRWNSIVSEVAAQAKASS